MFSLLEKIAGFLLTATKTYQEQQDRKRRREFGKDLITCYMRLLEVTANGYQILRDLEYFVRRYEAHMSLQDDWVFDRGPLNKKLADQSINLTRLYRALHNILMELRVLSPEVAEQIKFTTGGKLKSIGEFSKLFGPLWDYRELLDKGKFPTKSVRTNQSSIISANSYEELQQKQQIFLTNEYEPVEAGLMWDEITYKRLKAYLEREMPRERLKTIEKCADEIRKMIIQHFKLEEILWSLDKKFYEIR